MGEQKKPNKKKNNNNKNKKNKSIAFWIVLALVSIAAVRFSDEFQGSAYSIPYNQFNSIINNDKIRITKAWVSKNDQGVEFRGFISKEALKNQDTRAELINVITKSIPKDQDFYFTTYLPQITQSMMQKWEEKNIPFEFKPEKMNWFSIILSMLPWLLIIFFWIFIFRQMQGGSTGAGGGRGIFSFGKSKAKLVPSHAPKTTFEDVAGADEAKIELEEIIDFLKDPKKFELLGGKIPKGVLLLGAPGTGKTLLARAVAGEAGVPFFSMSGSDFVEMFVGVGASRVRDLFEQGKKNAPCIIFIDEIDAVGRHRGAGLGGGHDEREQTLNQLLVEMDGFEANSGVILIAATNRPDVLDPALLRPGRFDRQIVVDKPDIKGRIGILEVHTKKVPLADDVDLEVVARGTPGLSGADLANLVNEAALLAARFGEKKVTMLDIEEAKDKVMMGAERRSKLISDNEKKIIAYHEAGHALTGKMLKNADPVHKITIIPRGLALGVTFHLPEQDKYLNSIGYLEDEISVLFGGRVAEQLVFGEVTTGASNDLERASQLARKMVCQWGMSEKMGPITYGEQEEQIFLGREMNKHRDFSEETAKEIDEEIKSIILKRYNVTKKILTNNRDKLDVLANAVLEHEYLDSEEINKVLEGKKLEISKKPRIIFSTKKRPKKHNTEEQQDNKKEEENNQEEEATKGNKFDAEA